MQEEIAKLALSKVKTHQPPKSASSLGMGCQIPSVSTVLVEKQTGY